MLEAHREEERIRCPHCEHVQNTDSGDLGDMGLITYWGENDREDDTFECEACDQEFRVREDVRRTYDTAKLGENFQ